MSVKILSESAISREQTLVYQTLNGNFVVLIQQKKIGDVWTVYQHCLIPKLFTNAIAALPNKTEPFESSIITSGGFLPPKSIPAFENHDVDTLTDEVRRIFYRYDFECIPLCENQLGVYRVCDELADKWELKSAPNSPLSQTPTSEPVTLAVDPCPTVTPTPSPSLLRKSVKVINKSFATEIKISTGAFYPIQAFIHHSNRIQPYLKRRKAARHRKFLRLLKNEVQKTT